VPGRRGSDDLFPCPQVGANRDPLAPAKVEDQERPSGRWMTAP
jgi:hypothetical protein